MVYYNFQGDELQNEFDEKMTHKYGDKYRCVKNVYPDVYKLPEEEIQPMTHIIRYQGDTMEEAEDLLRKHIKKNEPMWKEMCYIGDTQNDFSIQENLSKNFGKLASGDFLNPRRDFDGIKYAQNNIISDATQSDVMDYSLYGDGFDKEFIDKMKADKRFQALIKKTLENEGGYANDPDDSGGETNYGISHQWYPNEDIKNMTPERASAIYYRDYWKRPKIDLLPDTAAGMVFDTGVNQGQWTSIKHLQNALGVKVDGIIGPDTLNGLENADFENVHLKFRNNASQELMNNIEKNPKLKKFENGLKKRYNSY